MSASSGEGLTEVGRLPTEPGAQPEAGSQDPEVRT